MSASKLAPVAEEDIRQFREDGVVCLRGVIDQAWRDRLETAIERDMEDPGPFHHGYPGGGGRFHGNSRR